MRDGSYEGGDAPEAATVIMGSDSSASLAVTWSNERVSAVYVCSSDGPTNLARTLRNRRDAEAPISRR